MITTNKEVTFDTIQDLFNQCIGSERFFRHSMIRSLIYTEGVKAFAEFTNAYWFIDLVASYMYKVVRNNSKYQDYFNVVGVKVNEDNTGHFYVRHDKGTRKYIKQDIPFIDLPKGEYSFFLIYDGSAYTLLVKSEY